MAIFAVVAFTDASANELRNAVLKDFAAANYPLAANAWLIATKGTAEALTEKLGILNPGGAGHAIVVEAASYFGRGNPAIWSWITANWERSALG